LRVRLLAWASALLVGCSHVSLFTVEQPAFPHQRDQRQSDILPWPNHAPMGAPKSDPKQCEKRHRPETKITPVKPTAVGFYKIADGKHIVEQPVQSEPFVAKENVEPLVIDIDPTWRNQRMWGYGANLTESCWSNLERLDEKSRKDLFHRLFARDQGAGLSLMRIPLGATDYSMDNFTLNDTPNNQPDPHLTYFDFSRAERLVKYLRLMQKINPDVRFILSPWTAPAWMKENKSVYGGRLHPQYSEAYAKYIIRSLKEFARRGIKIDYFTVVNEPYIHFEKWTYPQMEMSTQDQVKLIRYYLAPMLAKEWKAGRIKTQLLVLDYNWQDAHHAVDLLRVPEVRRVTAGVAFHCYGGNPADAAEFLRDYPDIPTVVTECSALLNHNKFADFKFWNSHFAVDGTNLGQVGALGWNLCLDETGGPQNGGCPDCRGMVTIDEEKNITLAHELHALEVTSRYVQRGAWHLSTTDLTRKKLRNAAFLNPDNSRVFVARNDSKDPISVSLRNENCETSDLTIPPNAAVSLKWSPASNASSETNLAASNRSREK
jgi:glucosylceramidase